MKNKIILLILILTTQLTAQNAEKTQNPRHFSVQWLGWTLHPYGGSMPQNNPWKLDPKATFLINPGVAFSYDWQLNKNVFWRAAAGYYGDCALLHAGYVHFGFRWEALRFGRHSFNGGLGPTLFFRQDWHRFSEYKGDPIYNNRVWQGWQYRFIPVGEVEYLFRINKRWQFQYSVVSGYPVVINSKMGVRFKLN